MENNLKSIEKAIEDKRAELTKLQNIYDRSTVLKDRLLNARKNYGTFLSSRSKVIETLSDLGIVNPETIPVNGFSSANLEKAINDYITGFYSIDDCDDLINTILGLAFNE